MTGNTGKNEPIRQAADALTKWAASRERKLPKEFGHISFYGSSLKVLENLPKLVEDQLNLMNFKPNQIDSIRKDFDELYEEAKDVDRLRGEDEGSGEIAVMSAKSAARRLSDRLMLIADTDESYQKQTLIVRHIEKPAEIEQNSAPAKGDVNMHISGGIQAKNLQIGHDASIFEQPVIEEKKKGIIEKLLEILGFIIPFVRKILWPK